MLDPGSKYLKAGFANSVITEDEPRVLTPSTVETNETSASCILHPVQVGRIVNFDQFEALLYYVLYGLLGWEVGDEGNLIVSEALQSPKSEREQLTQLAFEVFNVPGLFIQDSAVLSMYAVGKLTGCVVDLGHEKFDLAIVYEGTAAPTNIRRLPYAGKDLTQYLKSLLGKDVGLSEQTIEQLKELCTKVCDTSSDCANLVNTTAEESYVLPDGKEVKVNACVGAKIGEALLNPSHMGSSSPGLVEAICECIYSQVEYVARKQAFENILVTGGGSRMSNLATRLLKELRMQVPPTVAPGLCPIPEYLQSQDTATYAPLLGAAILAKVIVQQSHFFTKSDYEESGPYGIHRKCS